MPTKQKMCERIGQYAVTSLLYEVAATPKPGLVDRLNSGAHKDMDFFSFMASTAALSPFFLKCARRGADFEGEDGAALFCGLRKIGLKAEQSMFQATGGVNTHKGLIFSLGVISAAAAACHRDNPRETVWDIERLCDMVAQMTKGLCARELDWMEPGKKLTYGERLYREYGLKGVRGEVESGFETVRTISLPAFSNLMASGEHRLNDVLVQTLLHLIAVNDDTNIVAKRGMDALDYAKGYAARGLAAGGALTTAGMELLLRMDRDFIERNISPGGSADLLAVTVMLHLLATPAAEWFG